MRYLLIILLAASAARAQNPRPPGAPALDCRTAATDMNPPSGVREFCAAELEIGAARAARDPDDKRRLLAAAASSMAAAIGRLNDPALKTQALATIMSLIETDLKDDVAHAERLLRDMLLYYPGDTLPLRKLVKLLELQERWDEAEAMLLGARQQAPEDVEVIKDLAQFYTRLAAQKSKGGE